MPDLTRVEWLALTAIVLQCVVIAVLAVRTYRHGALTESIDRSTKAIVRSARAQDRCTDALLRTHQGQELMNISNRLVAERLRLHEAQLHRMSPPPTEQSA